MAEFVVTGSSGQVGRPALAALRAQGADVLGLTRSGGPGAVAADLLTGRGVEEALQGAGTVLHLATGNNRRDVRLTSTLIAAAQRGWRRTPRAHLDRGMRPASVQLLPGSRHDRAARAGLRRTGDCPADDPVPFTDRPDFSAQKASPVVLAPQWRFQPIAVDEVVARLVELAIGRPQGRVDDIGGPVQHPMRELHAAWKQATGSRRPELMVRWPGKLSAAYDAGVNLVPGPAYGQRTVEQYLRDKYRRGMLEQ